MLIWSPETHVVARTEFVSEEFNDWIDFNGLDEVANPNASCSPLAQLWMDVDDGYAGERLIEFAGRHCYHSWVTGRDRASYIQNIIDMGHGSVLEHPTLSFAIQGVSRSLTHELVRHRVGVAISQESQRYVDAKDIRFVVPPIVSYIAGGAVVQYDGDGVPRQHPMIEEFTTQCLEARHNYEVLQSSIKARLVASRSSVKTTLHKRANEAARALLPNAAETRLTWTANYRLLRHFFFVRGGSGADLEIRRLAVQLLEKSKEHAPRAFHDLYTLPLEAEHFGVPIIGMRP